MIQMTVESPKISWIQFSSFAQLCLTLCNPVDCSTPCFPVHQQLPELAQTHVHWVCDAIHPSHSLSSPSPHAFNFPSIRVFPKESAHRIRWPKYQSFSFSISPSSEYSGLISFRIDWLDLLAVQGTLKSLLQHHNSSELSFLYGPTLTSIVTAGKTIALTIWTFVGKVMSLLFNMLSRLAIAFLPKSQCFLISWPAGTVCSDFGAQENKVCLCFHCFSYLPWDQMPWSLFLECWVLSQLFHSPFSLSSRGSLVFLHFLP